MIFSQTCYLITLREIVDEIAVEVMEYRSQLGDTYSHLLDSPLAVAVDAGHRTFVYDDNDDDKYRPALSEEFPGCSILPTVGPGTQSLRSEIARAIRRARARRAL